MGKLWNENLKPFEAKKVARFSPPFIPLPYLLSPIRLAIRQTYERLFSSNESYENEASQFNGEQFTISCLFHRRDNTLFVSWNRANEKRGG